MKSAFETRNIILCSEFRILQSDFTENISRRFSQIFADEGADFLWGCSKRDFIFHSSFFILHSSLFILHFSLFIFRFFSHRVAQNTQIIHRKKLATQEQTNHRCYQNNILLFHLFVIVQKQKRNYPDQCRLIIAY